MAVAPAAIAFFVSSLKATHVPEPGITVEALEQELIELLQKEGIEIKGTRRVAGFGASPAIANDGFGSALARRPDVIGFDPGKRRIVFGVVRPDRGSLDSEEALEEYNVFLDHNARAGDQASVLYVIMPDTLVNEFTSIMTHYIHREYWHRVIIVPAKNKIASGAKGAPSQ